MRFYIKNFIAKVHVALYENRLKNWVNDYKLEQIKKRFKSVGDNFQISLPLHLKNPKYISVGNNFQSLYNLRIEAWDSYIHQKFSPSIRIGNNVSINTDCHIGCINEIVISDNVMIASKVYITDHTHGESSLESIENIANQRSLISSGPVIIDENVWIGEGVCILPGIRIGKNSIIGANAVVTKNIPANAIAAGVPAKIIKQF